MLFSARSKNLFTEKITHCGCKNQVASFSSYDEDWLIQVSGTIMHAEAAEKLNVSLDQLRGFLRKKIFNGSNLISGLQKKTTG